jgi:hypothetical protein
LAQVDAAAGRYVFANGLLSYDALIAAQWCLQGLGQCFHFAIKNHF